MTRDKTCTQCGENKKAGEFYANARHSTGLSSWCRPCTRERVAARKAADPEKIREEKRRHYERNKGALNAKQTERRRANGRYAVEYQQALKRIGADRYREQVRERAARYRDRNRQRVNARSLARRNRNRQAEIERDRAYKAANRTELNARRREAYQERQDEMRARAARRRALKIQRTPQWADEEAIARKYRDAVERSEKSGVAFEVDHHVPLVSDLVCGLHCEANLEVVRASMNRAKGNRWWSDMP